MNSQELNDLLSILEIHKDISNVTTGEVNAAFRRLALALHPDKAGDEKTAAFQKLRSAYERVKEYLEKKPDGPKDVVDSDEEVFFKDNFDMFNFPYENQGSFTVKIEDYLANTWQASLSSLLGEATVNINSYGTECDRFWKVIFEEIEVTVHIYNNPKNKKGSKLMIQGSRQSILCAYVFNELPKIYKIVSANKPTFVQTNTKLRKKTVKSTVNCDQCKFKSTLIKMKMHLKTVHGPRPVRASKRFQTFTPPVKDAKKSKSVKIINCEGIADNDSILLEDSFSGKVTAKTDVRSTEKYSL